MLFLKKTTVLVPFLILGLLLAMSGLLLSDHNGLHVAPCNAADTVGGGDLGNSPGPVGPPSSLGWDVGSGQCNGSFTIAADPAFPGDGGGIELGLRAEQRRVGQVARTGSHDYEVQTGPDTTGPVAVNRAWWNFQASIAYDGIIEDLDALSLTIITDAGPNVPSSPVFDLLALRAIIDDRNNQPNATVAFSDLYQISQNPEFRWFAPAADPDANPTGAFDYDAEGAWRFILTATKDGESARVAVCIHTPNAACIEDEDLDGITDNVDACSGTVLPEGVPTRSLGVNRFALVDDDASFDTASKGKGKGPRKSFTLTDTAGCSCEQIIESLGLGKGHSKFGCSISAMEEWVSLVNP